ncbi:MAG: hypothetical protein ACYCVP_08525 [Thermoplasmataceae archaeon]
MKILQNTMRAFQIIPGSGAASCSGVNAGLALIQIGLAKRVHLYILLRKLVTKALSLIGTAS